ncbi:hypothetical protein C2845_PM07G18000 [Panicum miliaceum]|uniref:Uncharacterized protein n=1 Tax=Panicum miliaceum TaxID=4540 RepID=A0A3L6SNQ1_PANMI|nr:hypothetical protein C2845_PM07G18000 [Panicum miliaceum]
MPLVKSTPACKHGANPDGNLPNRRRTKSNLRPRDEALNPNAMKPNDRSVLLICALNPAFAMCIVCLMVWVFCEGANTNVAAHRPDLFVRLIGEGGLDPQASQPASPVFQLAFDVDGVSPGYRACSGGGDSLLRVSDHDMILAWGQMPYFCIRGGQSTGVATLEAMAEASVLREEVRNLVRREVHVVGRVEFDVEGEVAGLGYLRCKFFLLEDRAADVPRSLCLVHH